MTAIFLPRHKMKFTQWLLCFVMFLMITAQERVVHGAEEQEVLVSETKEVLDAPKSKGEGLSINSKAKALSGRWAVVHQIQDVLDDAPPSPPDYRGRVMTFDVLIMELPKFWKEFEARQADKKIKEIAAVRKHKIIAAGMFAGNVAQKPRAYLNAWFILTQKEGETFLCLLNIDSFQHGNHIDQYEFTPCRIHHIPGKVRKKDLLLVEMDDGHGNREVYAFQHVAEVPAHNAPPRPQYRAQDYQHLIGKSKSDVKKILRSGMRAAGITHDKNGYIEFAQYNGMTVYYSVDGVVKKVIPGKHRFDD